jgi:photosystem II stability/assembly factor-like uncharacterized protein
MPLCPRRFAFGFAVCAASSLASGAALANGRFPRAERLVENPARPEELMLAATYGLLRSDDRGQSWSYICEASFAGSDGYVGDPLLAVLADSTAIVDVQTNLNVSHDQGCTWPSMLSNPSGGILDFTVVSGSTTSILALESSLTDGGIVTRLESSADEGRHWTTLNTVPVATAYTVEVASSRPQRVYVSGSASDGAAQLLVSDDGGVSWLARAIPSATKEDLPFIAAVHPSDPDRVFVRTDTWNSLGATRQANDALLFTDDAGKSWHELFRTGAKLLGFALSPDASTVLLGYGDPIKDVQNADHVDTSVTGLYSSKVGAFSFERISDTAVSCLAWTPSGVYQCLSGQGTALQFSPLGLPSDGGAFQTLLSLDRVKGPLTGCTRDQGACALAWQLACVNFGACPGGGSPDAGTVDASLDAETATGGAGQAGSSARAGSARVSANGGGAGALGATNAGGEAGTAAAKASSGGCGCQLSASEELGCASKFGAWLGLFLVVRRKRRR